jgi:serine/threonine protein phosphatase PrpC
MHIASAACTHVGRRDNNEDSYCTQDATGLYAVADGMGGYDGGEVASRLAIDTLEHFVRRNALDDNVTWPFALDPRLDLDGNLLATGVKLADAHVAAARTGRLRAMGTTVAALLARGDRAVIGHVGDSRVYRLRDGAVTPLTRDHSLYEELLAMGSAVGDRADFPHANVITRALGLKPPVQVEVRVEALRPGDVYLLCTDGLYDSVSLDDMAHALGTLPPADAARTLVHLAYAHGSRDNITAVVASVAPSPPSP